MSSSWSRLFETRDWAVLTVSFPTAWRSSTTSKDASTTPTGNASRCLAISCWTSSSPASPGIEILDWIRRHPDFKDLSVIVLSSSKEANDIAQARELGIDHYLVKPVSYAHLLLWSKT